MAFMLKLDELIDTASHLRLPGIKEKIAIMNGIADELGAQIAERLGIDHGEATYEGADLCGTGLCFYARTEGQALPAAIAEYDDPSEWGTR